MEQMIRPPNTKEKHRFCYLTLNEILTILCVAAIPLALGIYTAIYTEQQKKEAEQNRQFELKQATELRQQVLYDKYISDMYNLDKDGYLDHDKNPWAFANAYHRAVQRQWDSIRKADVLMFLKEKELIGKTVRSIERSVQSSQNIIQLNKLNFDNVILKSLTGSLNQLDFSYISFDEISMINSKFLFVDLHNATFYRARLNHIKFDNSSLAQTIFNSTELQEADFGNSDLTRTQFINTDLLTAKLTREQLNQAIFINTRLPNGTSITSTTTTTTTITYLNTSTDTHVYTSTASTASFPPNIPNETTASTASFLPNISNETTTITNNNIYTSFEPLTTF